jgi:superfamily II DNA or RNA helicase
MNQLRTYRLEEQRQAVLKAAKFRKPQREAFDEALKLIRGLDDDLPRISTARLLEQLREASLNVSALPPNLVFELATGVGKTRLMGALIAFLYRSGQSRNAVILSSRSAIVDKLERESQTNSAKYLFLDPTLVQEPNLCFRSTLDSFRPDPERLNVFVLSPQTITGGDRRFARRTDYSPSMLDYLRGVPDLVVYVDESHHLQGGGSDDIKAWRAAVHDLKPRLQFGFTATPLPEAEANILYRYSLADCLRQGLYTKAVKLWVEQAPAKMSEEEWDRVTLDFGIQRLERKRLALRTFADEHPEFGFIEPVMLVAARDTDHAEEIAQWLKERRGFAPEELHVAHSQRKPSEDELAKLVAIDRPDNRIRIVVNVFQLTEGWDVTNVYVVAPLRAMATYQNAVQSMGRGLRLPAGRRIGDPEVDTLDVLCFGRETFEQIVEQATEQFGSGPAGSATMSIASPVEDKETGGPTKIMRIGAVMKVSFEVLRLTRVPPEPALDFEISKAPGMQVVSGIDIASRDRVSADEDVLRYSLDTVVRNASLGVLDKLKYLSPVEHYAAVEKLVRDLLVRLGAGEGDAVAIDPYKVAMLVGEEVDRRYKSRAVTFEVGEDTRTVTPSEFEWRVSEDLEQPIPKSEITVWQ